MVTRSKPDFTFGELGGVDDLAALGIEIEDDAPQEQRRTQPPANKVRRLRETLARWTREQEDKLIQINPEAVARDRETAEALGVTDLQPEYAEVLERNETIPGRIRDRLAGMAKDLPQAKLGKHGSRGVWWAEVDPLTHRWIVPADQSAVASGDLVVGMFNGTLRSAVIDKPEDIADGILLDAGNDQVLGNRVGQVLQRFGDSYHDIKRRHESGELRQEWEAQEAVSGRGLPEPSASPPASDQMPEPSSPESTSEVSVEMAQATVRDPDTGETVVLTAAKEGDGPTVVTAKSEGEAGPLMAATEAAMADVAERSAVPSETDAAEGSGFEPLPDDFDLSAYGFGDKQDDASEPAPEPDKYELANQHGEMLADQSGHERDSDEWRRIAREGYDAYLDELEGIERPRMSWTNRTIVPTETGYAVVEPAPTEPRATDAPGFEPLSPVDGCDPATVSQETPNVASEHQPAPAESPTTEGEGFEPLPDDYDLSAYGFGGQDDPPTAPDTDDATPEPPPIADGGGERVVVPISGSSGRQQAEFEGYKVSDNFAVHREAIANSRDEFVEGERWSITHLPTGAVLLTSKSNLQDTMAFAGRIVPLIDRDNADEVRAAVTPDIQLAINAISNRQNNLDTALRHLDIAARRPAPETPAPSEMAQTDVDVSDPQARQQWAAGILQDQWFERGLEARQAQYSGNLISQIGSGMDAPWVNRQEIAREYIESLIGPPDAAKGAKYSFKKQRELHQKLQALAAEGQETTPTPGDAPETPDADPDDTSPASESPAEASEPEPEPPPPAPVLADAEPGPPDPPDVITPTTGKGPPEPPKVASVSRNDTAEQLQQKWKQADQSIDAYAKSFGIAGIPDDAARLELRPDGTIGVERLRVTPQGSAYRTPAPKATGTGGGGGGGSGGGSAKPSAPAIGLRKSWERMSHAEKQAVIDVINDALARRALLSSALVTMTCSPTGDLALSQGQKMATIVGSCAPRSSPVSPRQSLQAHPWLSNREVATLGGGKRKSGQGQNGKKRKTRR